MIFFLILMVALLFYGMQVAPKGQFFDDYCGIKQTSTINGIFTILIFVVTLVNMWIWVVYMMTHIYHLENT